MPLQFSRHRTARGEMRDICVGLVAFLCSRVHIVFAPLAKTGGHALLAVMQIVGVQPGQCVQHRLGPERHSLVEAIVSPELISKGLIPKVQSPRFIPQGLIHKS
eukprot:8036897-Heterocapsa_arctica.AAC.1